MQVSVINVAALLLVSLSQVSAVVLKSHVFSKRHLTDLFWAEGACSADINRDGKADLVYGPFWFEGKEFQVRHEYRPANASFKRVGEAGLEAIIPGYEGALGVNNAYSDDFLNFAYDFNNDGWVDLLVIDFPGKEAAWYENPKGQAGYWPRHGILAVVDNESPGFGDITGDGKPELVCCSGGFIGFAQADWKQPASAWTFHPVSPKGDYQRFTHGLGFGDVNGDGRSDLIEKDGWWEQPKSLAGDPVWTRHLFKFGNGGAQMFAYDVNGDGLNDIITSLQAHGCGIAWFEQIRTNGEISFLQHTIVGCVPAENPYGVKFSQPHALALADVDGDGLADIVTGKRFWAHGPHGDPEPNAPAVLYWFQLVRPRKGEANFLPHLVDDDSGVGTQVFVAPVTDKKLPDIIVGNKKGLFLFQHKAKKVSRSEWEAAQPKLLSPTKPIGNN